LDILLVIALCQGLWPGATPRKDVFVFFCGVFGIRFAPPPSFVPASSVLTMNSSTISVDTSPAFGQVALRKLVSCWGVPKPSSNKVASEDVDRLVVGCGAV
jgi:hypothetical protein